MTGTVEAQLLHLAAAALAGVAAGCLSYLLLTVRGARETRATPAVAPQTDLQRRLMQAGQSLRESRSRRRRRPLASALDQAGIALAPERFAMLCGLAGLGALASATWLSGSPWLGLAGAAVTALILPRVLLRQRIRERRERFRTGFAGYLETLARCIRSGYSLEQSLTLAASASEGLVQQLCGRLASEAGAGIRLEAALDRLTGAMPLQELRVFACMLLVQQRTGASMAQVVDMLAHGMRQEARLRAKIATHAAQAKLSAGIMGVLPLISAGSVTVFAPDYLTPMLSHPTGRAMLAFTALWMALGWLIMRALSRPRTPG
jgi:tight adherence protein B